MNRVFLWGRKCLPLSEETDLLNPAVIFRFKASAYNPIGPGESVELHPGKKRRLKKFRAVGLLFFCFAFFQINAGEENKTQGKK